MSPKLVQWLTTAPSRYRPSTGFDAGTTGWCVHAVPADQAETFEAVRERRAICGLLPRFGWGLDLFITKQCQHCLRVIDRERSAEQNHRKIPLQAAQGSGRMLNRRMDGTAQDMIASGQWAKAGRGRYVHASGAEIRKEGSCWIASTDPGFSWSRLWVARHRVESAALSSEVKEKQ